MNKKELPKIIAEIAQGFEGDLKQSKLLVKAASSAGANAVKFQLVYADELSTEDYVYYDLFKSLEMTNKQWDEINNYSQSLGIELILDVFGEKSLSTACKLNLKSIKIHGTDITNIRLLEKVSKSKINSIILGIGGASWDEVKIALEILKNKELILLAGFQGYPTNISDNLISRLKYLDKKSRLYHQNFNIGFAPHPDTRDLNSLVSLVAIGAGARYLERHLTLGKVMKLEDYESALNPDEFSTYVKQIKRGFKAFGKSNSYELSIAEKKYRKGIRRDVVASINLKKGTVLSSKHLDLKRSSEKKGIKSLNDVYGQILKKDLNKNDVILKSYLK